MRRPSVFLSEGPASGKAASWKKWSKGGSQALLALLVWLAIPPAWASEAPTIAVLPFAVHSKEDLSFLGEGLSDMLTTRIEKAGDIATIEKPRVQEALSKVAIADLNAETALRLGAQIGADVVVLGSLTKVGERISLDVTLLDTEKGESLKRIFIEGESLSAIPPKVSELARFIYLKALGRELIVAIGVRGNRHIEKGAIKLAVQSKEGDVFSLQLLQEDLKRVYQMGYFEDVQIESADRPQGKAITFVVKERPLIREIKVVGNKNIQTQDLQKEMGTRVNRILDYNQINKDVAKITRLYNDKGYYEAAATYEVGTREDEGATVAFRIEEKEISKVEGIRFQGNEAINDKQLKRIMETKEANWLSWITSAGIFKDDAFNRDLTKLGAYYYTEGYIEARVGEPTITHEKGEIFIDIPIEEGSRFAVGAVDVSGDLIEDKDVLVKELKTVSGDTFSSKTLNDDIVGLTNVYANKGYAFADVSPLTSIDAEKKEVNVAFDIAKGKLVFFEKVDITGNTRTRDKVIRRELRINEGDLYSGERLKRSRQEVNNLGFFKEVKFNTERGGADDKIVLNVEVEERPTGSLSFGAGFSSVDSLVGMMQVSQNNLFGKGQQLTLRAQLGGRNSQYLFNFTEPWFLETRVSAGVDLFSLEREYEDFDRDSTGGGLRFGFPAADYTRFNVQYEYESIDVTDVDEDAALEILESEGTSTTGSITAGIIRDSLDDRFLPRSGSVAKFSTQFAGVGGDNNFVTLIGSVAKYWPLPWDTSFMARGTMGYSFGYAGDDVPIFERFFLGGLDSMRGFEDRSVGPEESRSTNPDADDPDEEDVVGGEKELHFNFEYLFPLMRAAGVRGLVFFDIGNAYRQNEGYLSDLRTSVGAGVRWYSPFGPLRLELGMNLDPEDDESTTEFHFSMGALF
jgi:outer membrane protein insertion porin family